VLLRKDYGTFVPVGVSKLFSQILAHNSFELVRVDGRVLVRNDEPPDRWLLHLAFQVRAGGAPRSLRALGRRAPFYERELATFVERVGKKELEWMNEKDDHGRLNAKHGPYVAELAAQTLDLPIPEAERRGR
jgi:hypothetical protein